jgi:hypothetical protein
MPDIRVGTPGVSGPASGALRPSDALVYPQNVSPAEVSGGYYGPLLAQAGLSLTTDNQGADVLMAIPFITQVGGAVTSLALRNTSAAESGTLIRTGIYTDNAGSPSTLVAEASVTTLTAAAAIREPTISATLTPNTRYWFAIVSNGNATLRAFNATTGSNFSAVAMTSFGNYTFRNGLDMSASGALTRTFAYGALPASWGTATGASSNFPIISWKKT